MAICAANKLLAGVLLLAGTSAFCPSWADQAKADPKTTVVATLPKTAGTTDPTLQRAIDLINEVRTQEEKIMRRQNMRPSHPDKVVKNRRSHEHNTTLILGGSEVMSSLPM